MPKQIKTHFLNNETKERMLSI